MCELLLGGFGGCGVWLISVCLVECCYSGGLRYGLGCMVAGGGSARLL